MVGGWSTTQREVRKDHKPGATLIVLENDTS